MNRVVIPCLRRDPGQVERIDRDAVAAQAGPGIERLEAERLGLGGLDHLPDVDPHPVVEDLQLVDQGDVHGPVGVLEDLAGLGDLGAGDGHDPDHDPGIERGRQLEARGDRARRRPWGSSGRSSRGLPGSSRSGLKARKKSVPARSPAGLEHGQHDLAGRARIGRALQDDELAGPEPGGDRPGRGGDVGQVGIAGLGQRGRHADHDRVRLVRAAGTVGSPRSGRRPRGSIRRRCGRCSSRRVRAARPWSGRCRSPGRESPRSAKARASGSPT